MLSAYSDLLRSGRRHFGCCRRHLLIDSEKLINAMTTGMPLLDGCQTVAPQRRSQFPVMQNFLQQKFHFTAVARQKIVFPFSEEPFHVLPRGTNKREATRHCFERP